MNLLLRRILSAIVVAFLISGSFGCAKLGKSKFKKHQTIQAICQRDTDVARWKHEKAIGFIENCRLAEAEALLQDALIVDSNFGPAHNSLGAIYLNQNKLYLAAWEFEQAHKLMPDAVEPYNNLGLVHEKAGKYGQAIEYFLSLIHI